MFNEDLLDKQQAFKLASVVRSSNIINKLNLLPGKYKWVFSSKYGFFEYTLKLYGDNFYSRRNVEISFNTSTLDTSINFYKEEKTSKGTILKPIDVDFYVFQEVSKFLDHIIKEYKLFDKKKKWAEEKLCRSEAPDALQLAINLFGNDFVNVVDSSHG